MVSAFYEDNKKYFSGEVKSGMKFKIDEYELESYYRLIKQDSIASSDDRKYTAEIITDVNIKLKDNVLAVIMPISWGDSYKDRVFKQWGAEFMGYPEIRSLCPEYNNAYLYSLISQYLENKSLY